MPDLELKYKNEQIQELVITKYAIWNSGNEVLQRSDIVEIKPLQVSCTAENTRIKYIITSAIPYSTSPASFGKSFTDRKKYIPLFASVSLYS